MNTTIDMPIALTGGMVYLLMALTVARMPRAVLQPWVVGLWTLGSAGNGVALLLVAARNHVPRFAGFELVALIALAATLLQTAALRRLLGRPPLPRATRATVVAVMAMCVLLWLLDDRRALFALALFGLSAAIVQLAWHAWLTARSEQSASAVMLAASQALLAGVLLARAVSVAAGVAAFQHGRGGVTFLLLHATLVLAALYGSLGFMGLMLDISRRAEVRAREAEARAREGQVAEAARREAAEQAAQDLRDLLQQRDALSAERERMLQLLAHEIRQPLHNASGALHAAGQVMRQQATPGDDHQLGQAEQRLGRANAVLGEVRAVLDNTLAAATLLTRSAPVAVQEVDLAFLIDLALGDLDEPQRQRVQVRWRTDLREAEVEPGLLRLALRNLLTNAFSHGGPGVAVQLQVDEQTQPPALLLRVVDDGPGLAAGAGGPAGSAPGPAQRPSLGLAIVRQVAALHGGRLDLLPAAPRGLQAVLVLPLPAA